MKSKNKIAVIGGTGFELLSDIKGQTISTPYGKAFLKEKGNLIFLPRHGKKYLAPHRINFRANLTALKKKGVKSILATAACGSLRKNIQPRDFVLLSDFVDFTKSRIQTFNPLGAPNYIDMSEPYSEFLRGEILKAAQELKIKIHKTGIYACAEGPRFETKAEIRAFQMLGCEVVGMTQMPEVVLAAEAGIPYAALGIVTNYAAGLQKRISGQEVMEIMRIKSQKAKQLLLKVCESLI